MIWVATAATPANAAPTAATAAPGERSSDRLAGRDQPETEQYRQNCVGRDGHGQLGGEAGVATHDSGADQVGAGRLLALPGVPYHGERAHQGRQHRDQNEFADHGVGADGCAGGESEHPDSGTGRRDLPLPRRRRRDGLRRPGTNGLDTAVAITPDGATYVLGTGRHGHHY
jgi:hypothetical protein